MSRTELGRYKAMLEAKQAELSAGLVGSRIRLGPFRASKMAHLDTDIMPQLTAAVFGQPGESGAWRRPTGGAV